MNFILRPWQLYFLILAGWINRQQQEVINHLRIENQILKEKLGKNESCSTMISDAGWPSVVKSWVVNCPVNPVHCTANTSFLDKKK